MNGNDIDAFVRKVASLFPAKLAKEAESHLRRKATTMEFDAAARALEEYREAAQGKAFYINEFIKHYAKQGKAAAGKTYYRVHWRASNGEAFASIEVFDDLEKAQLRAAMLNGEVKTTLGRLVTVGSGASMVARLESVPRGTIRDTVNSLRHSGRLSDAPLPPRISDWGADALQIVSEEIRTRERRA